MQIVMNCPFCSSRRGKIDVNQHMSVDMSRHLYHCFSCSASPKTTGVPFSKLFNLDLMVHEVDLSDLKDRLNKLYDLTSASNIEYDLDLISWKVDKVETPIAYKYLTDRKFTDDEIKQYDLRVGKSYPHPTEGYVVNKWTGRVLFPMISEDKCRYIVGRTHIGHKNKYLNTSVSKSHVVYFLDQVADRSTILCEGIISAISATRSTGIQSISVLGKYPSDDQLATIRNKVDVIYNSLDGDVSLAERRELNKRLYKMGFKIYNIILPDKKDPDDLGFEYIKYFEKVTEFQLF